MDENISIGITLKILADELACYMSMYIAIALPEIHITPCFEVDVLP